LPSAKENRSNRRTFPVTILDEVDLSNHGEVGNKEAGLEPAFSSRRHRVATIHLRRSSEVVLTEEGLQIAHECSQTL
jgi:hypothetical protein